MISTAVLLYLLIRRQDSVERYISVICIWTLLCYLITQVLSVFEEITTKKLWACWGLCACILLFFNVINYRKNTKSGMTFHFKKVRIGRLQVAWGIFAVIMLFLAIKTVPYNYDSMTYHLPRVYHWLHNESIAHYATNIDRQVSTSGLAEYIILHIYAMLNRSDYLVNVLQCCSYLTNGILIYYIAKKINCSGKYCILASVLYYTSPIVFAEALTTQADNFAAMWALCFVYLLLDFLQPHKKILWDRECVSRVMLLSLCLGLGYLAKSSICIGLALFALWLLIIVISRKDQAGVIFKCLAVSVGIMAVLVAPEMIRNFKTFDAISSPDVRVRQIVGTLQPSYALINFVKNFTFNMPSIWIPNSSNLIYHFVIGLAGLVNVDAADPLITDYPSFVVVPEGNLDHDSGNNPIFIWLFIFCIFLFMINNKKQNWKDIGKQYYVAATIGIFVFCTIIRWEPWLGRFMISYMAVAFPALVYQLEAFFQSKKKRWGEWLCIAVLCFACGITTIREFKMYGEIALSQSRNMGYFRKLGEYGTELYEVYEELVELVDNNGFKKVGLKIGFDSCEYPLLVMLDEKAEVKHVNVTNYTAIYEDFSYIPDIIIYIDVEETQEEVECHGEKYGIHGIYNDKIKVFRREGF